MAMSKILSELNVKHLFNNVKRFLMDTFTQLDLDKAEALKPNHQKIFRKLRLSYVDLINETRQFCEDAIPSLEVSIEKIQKLHNTMIHFETTSSVNKDNDNNHLDIEMLSKLLDDFDPSDLLKKCSSLEHDVIAFNDEIRLDPSYKANQWKKWGGIILAGLTIAAAIALVVVMPCALPLAIGIVVGAGIVVGSLIAALHAIKTGFSAGQLKRDIQELSSKLKIANGQIGSIKKELSDMRIKRKLIQIQLLTNDVSKLLQYYKDMRENIEDIHQICVRPLANF